jgi:hypothetical protein
MFHIVSTLTNWALTTQGKQFEFKVWHTWNRKYPVGSWCAAWEQNASGNKAATEEEFKADRLWVSTVWNRANSKGGARTEWHPCCVFVMMCAQREEEGTSCCCGGCRSWDAHSALWKQETKISFATSKVVARFPAIFANLSLRRSFRMCRMTYCNLFVVCWTSKTCCLNPSYVEPLPVRDAVCYCSSGNVLGLWTIWLSSKLTHKLLLAGTD